MKRNGLFLILAVIAIFLLIPGTLAAYVPGWAATYYSDQSWTSVAGTRVDTHIFFADNELVAAYPTFVGDEDNWPFSIVGKTDDFSVVWDGYIDSATGDYFYFLIPYGTMQLYVDGVLTNNLYGDSTTSTGNPFVDLHLTPGLHHFVIKYHDITGDPMAAAFFATDWSGEYPVEAVHWEDTPTPVPEFPTMFVPVTFIAGLLGAVFLIRRTREH